MDYATALPLFFRGSERLLIVAASTLCIYLGYRLFKVVPLRREGEGSFTVGDLSITLTKVGPGVFFALFGAFVLYQSVQKSLDMTTPPGGSEAAAIFHLNWMGSEDIGNDIWLPRASNTIRILNCLEKNATGSKNELARLKDAIHNARIAIIADIWQSEWGSVETFKELQRGKVNKDGPVGRLYYEVDEGC